VADEFTKEDRAMLGQAARSLRLDPATLPDGNPFAPERDDKTTVAIREWIKLNHPHRASELIKQTGATLSLGAQLVMDGTEEMNAQVWKELEAVDPGWIQQQREKAEARMLADMAAKAEAFEAAGKARRERLYNRGPNLATEEHCNSWNRSMRGRMNQPARSLTGR